MNSRKFNRLLSKDCVAAFLYVSKEINKYPKKSVDKIHYDVVKNKNVVMEIKSLLSNSQPSDYYLKDKKRRALIKTMFRILFKLKTKFKQKRDSRYHKEPEYGGGNMFSGERRKPINKQSSFGIVKE